MPKSTAGANHDLGLINFCSKGNMEATHQPLPRLDTASFTSIVCRNSTAHYWTGFFVGDTIRNACGVIAVCDGILLEGAGYMSACISLF
jgi:hypothetical protein